MNNEFEQAKELLEQAAEEEYARAARHELDAEHARAEIAYARTHDDVNEDALKLLKNTVEDSERQAREHQLKAMNLKKAVRKLA
ncbi:hypothetical protein [Arthrobacter sp. ISL-30]|uniref:hypothetical protein n=1 Tax=Arthrobacter sp. ISL-30 TaxID=2819109 RepID=UPI001BEBBBA2|nr:hypothetical protein [Arthrobacter sp. ISL-30]MBT2513167.1 hypothetical protein [Arthrobacter sp. ISL-30]